MRSFGGKKSKNGTFSVVRILWIGLMVLVINLIVYLVHIIDVQRQFRAVKIEEAYEDLKSGSYIMQSQIADVHQNLVQIAMSIDNDPTVLEDDERLCSLLTSCNASGLYTDLLYISDEGFVYSYRGTVDEVDSGTLQNSYFVSQSELNLADGEFSEDGNGIMYCFEPVTVNGVKKGQVMAKKTMSELLEIEGFDKLRKNGDVFVISDEGDISLRDTDLFMDYGQAHKNLYDLLENVSADSYSKKNVAQLKQQSRMENSDGESKYDYLKTSIVDKYGRRDYVELKSIDGIRGGFLVSIYPESLYTDVTRSLFFRTLTSSSILFLLTIVVVVYMWLTSKISSDTIKKLAYEDPVTGGKNDNYFREFASQVLFENTSIPYVVTRFDIANFRYINEAYGHVRADELLRIIDRECSRIFSKKEFCARMNADQFLLLARNDQDFEAKMEELLKVINEQAREIGIMFPIRLKRGVYPVRREDTDIGIIIDHANAARKSLTGDEKVLVATYSEQIVSQMFLNDKIESDMENAMKTEEFKVFIQAKWDIKNDHVHGGEALVRWIKEDGTRIFPDQFIPVFEKNGFVEKLDMYMLEQVCKHQRQLIDAGKEIYPISVNQSRLLMHNPDYLHQVERLMKKYRIPNGFVELEITETVFQDERALMISTTNELKKMEIQLAMDDFGSGYSSLNMLKDVPFDVIKIDREFFSESITSEASVWILQKIIEMAEGLGIKTLCEGVENEEQVKLLRELGCYYVQGYYYSKPMPFDEYIEKYCEEKENGKEYYDNLFESQLKIREQRRKEEEEEASASVATAVEQFKKSYTATAGKQGDKEVKKEEDDGKKKLSSEEMKLAYLAGAGKTKEKKEEKAPETGDKGTTDEKKAAEHMTAAEAVRRMKQAEATASNKDDVNKEASKDQKDD
ncbi:MAG: bifunctional diguanylate cyclase/phosphodiesterase [Lachnospiraceae bacterium]|nr:bifunctional diguanylate cyclase/phosphodiesterase [Lachnospiraceae bacterium]